MTFSRDDKIAHINKSPESVAVHDKEQWLSIFSQYSIVEDPVGSTPHVSGLYDRQNKKRGNETLSRFYETFIAPNQIRFEVDNDIVCNNHVVRDLTVHIDMAGVSVAVPMHLLYELIEESNELKIHRLAAHWELLPMMTMLMKNGTDALPVVKSLSTRMMKHQGISGAMGFMAGVGKLGAQGKKVVDRFFAAYESKDTVAMESLFIKGAVIYAPLGQQEFSPAKIIKGLGADLTYRKILTAGYAVSVSITLSFQANGDPVEGVAIFEFDTKNKKINRLSFYYE